MQKSCINWDSHTNHMKDVLHRMMKSEDLTDVTLVCDDKTRIKVHKVVLSACSTVFKSIIDELPETNSVIYLRGVKEEELKNILEFMYTGEVMIIQERMDLFLQVARDLKIVEIANINSIGSAGSNSIKANKYEEEIKPMRQHKSTSIFKSTNEIEMPKHNIPKNVKVSLVKDSHLSKTKEEMLLKYYDDQVKAQNTHVEKNEMFSCDKCNHVASSQTFLNNHFRVVHLGLKCVCNQCGKIFAEDTKLNSHLQFDH